MEEEHQEERSRASSRPSSQYEASQGFRFVPDNASQFCMLCEKKFTIIVRRHHCRKCGKLVCNSCSMHRAPLHQESLKMNRFCDECYVHHLHRATGRGGVRSSPVTPKSHESHPRGSQANSLASPSGDLEVVRHIDLPSFDSANHWLHRRAEIWEVMNTGLPCSALIKPGQKWHIICAHWLHRWYEFVRSRERMPPPGPIDNSWMLDPDCGLRPFSHLTFREDHNGPDEGHFCKVTPQVWAILLRIYGGGPAIWIEGPPIEQLSKWRVLWTFKMPEPLHHKRGGETIPSPFSSRSSESVPLSSPSHSVTSS